MFDKRHRLVLPSSWTWALVCRRKAFDTKVFRLNNNPGISTPEVLSGVKRRDGHADAGRMPIRHMSALYPTYVGYFLYPHRSASPKISAWPSLVKSPAFNPRENFWSTDSWVIIVSKAFLLHTKDFFWEENHLLIFVEIQKKMIDLDTLCSKSDTYKIEHAYLAICLDQIVDICSISSVCSMDFGTYTFLGLFQGQEPSHNGWQNWEV